MNVREALVGRSSCRAFDQRAVPREVLERIVNLALHAPSWCNTQPWQVSMVTGAALQRLTDSLATHPTVGPDIEFPERYEGVWQERRRAAGWLLYEAVGVPRGDREASRRQADRNLVLFDAPALAVVSIPRSLGPYALLDCGIFVQSLLLASTAQGVATIPLASIAAFAPLLREQLSIPASHAVVCGVALGYADIHHPANSFRTPRCAPEEVTRWWD